MIAIYLPVGTRISRFQNSLSGGFLSRSGRGLTDALPRGNSKREFGLGNLSGKVEMDMFGGLTKTSSRIAIAAALGMTLGGFVMSSHPAKAADLGRRLLRGSRGAGGRTRGDDRPQGQQEGVGDTVWLGGQIRDWWDDGAEFELLRRR